MCKKINQNKKNIFHDFQDLGHSDRRRQQIRSVVPIYFEPMMCFSFTSEKAELSNNVSIHIMTRLFVFLACTVV